MRRKTPLDTIPLTPEYLRHRARELKDQGRTQESEIMKKVAQDREKRGYRPKEENAPGQY